jgi:hypothetical protein
LKKQEDELEMK